MVWHRDRYRPPAAETFIEMAAEVAREVERAHNEILVKRPQLPLPVQGRGARE
jgi:hypothetical protein